MNFKKGRVPQLSTSTPFGKQKGTNLITGSLESLSDSFQIGSPVDVQPLPKATKPSMLALICKAIEAVGVPRKGASYLGIRKWILNCPETTIAEGQLTAHLRRAFQTGLDKEVLGRPKRSQDSYRLAGWFVVLKNNSPKERIPEIKLATGKPKRDYQRKAVAKTLDAQAANPTKLNSDSFVVEAKGKKPKVIAKKIKKPKVPTIKVPDTSMVKVSAKRSPKVVVPKNLKPKMLAKKTPDKITPEVSKPVSKPKGGSKRTKNDKTALVSEVKEPSESGTASQQEDEQDHKALKPKLEGKTVTVKAQSKKTKPKTRISSQMKAPRKDLSDTELEVKRPGRKSLKSYSSDTDITEIVSKETDLRKMRKR